jgi:hypothetical protein
MPQNTLGLLLPAILLSLTGGSALAADTGAQARQFELTLDRQLSALTNVVCHEEIERYARKGKTTNQLDTLDANVELLNGVEGYSAIREERKPLRLFQLPSLLQTFSFRAMAEVPGTWSVGEIVTLLRIVRNAIGERAVQVRQDVSSNLGPATLLTFTYPASSQRWYLKRNTQTHWMPFEGRVWISPETGEILRVCWRANDLPAEAGVSEVLWTVDFSPVDLSSRVLSVPAEAVFQITYSSGNRVDWNVTHFSEYRRYGSGSAIHFDR